MSMSKELPSRHEPSSYEDEIYKLWEQSGFFNPDVCIKKGVTKKTAKPFSMVLPPPNVTGTLHMGSAAMLAIQDILIRYHRMKGDKTLWLPGTDHAAIATQAKMERILYEKEGKTRHDLGREEFLKRVEAFAKESHDTIINQTKKMGASLDWTREAYTLDAKRNTAVNTAFKRMYDEGLIYRGARIVNWDPRLKTTISDDEIEWKEETTTLFYLQYGPFTIATARPETKFGDKYVVMHPDDKRYAEYTHGQKIELEWINGPITATIIKDKAIDMAFGTGVMTITPWHDAVDFEIAERHELEKEQIVDFEGKLLPITGEFTGIHIKKARPMIVEKLKTKGLLVKTEEDYTHRIATNSRGGGMIEPQIITQWFIAVNKPFIPRHSKIKGILKGKATTLKVMMRAVVKNGQMKILPKRFEKIYFHWVNNLHDWCISRQIWFGHRIPVWYKDNEMYCGTAPPKGEGWEQDPDTLDTWFSSSMWTFSTLGWPKNTKDVKTYHPTNVLETGYDILSIWVSRMILMTGYQLGDIPFHTVYLHGLVRDTQGKKMSKSLDNTIDPLEFIGKYGADATRLSLIIGAGPGSDIKLSEDKVRGYRNFATKLWNIGRFIMLNADAMPASRQKRRSSDRKIKTHYLLLEKITKEVSLALDNYAFHRAAETLYHYTWHTFADEIIEEMKPALKGDDMRKRQEGWFLLYELYVRLLVLLHPFMPFVTEEIWHYLPHEEQSMLMTAHWPKT